jgi:hypothetical protein
MNSPKSSLPDSSHLESFLVFIDSNALENLDNQTLNITGILDKSFNKPKQFTVLQPFVKNISSNSEIVVSPFAINHGCVSENGSDDGASS